MPWVKMPCSSTMYSPTLTLLYDGDRYVVRSKATGTPSGDFMGVDTDGTKSFEIMAIDIHRVVDGQIHEVHHLEDWPTAIAQLTS